MRKFEQSRIVLDSLAYCVRMVLEKLDEEDSGEALEWLGQARQDLDRALRQIIEEE
jgi:hypothetical protein